MPPFILKHVDELLNSDADLYHWDGLHPVNGILNRGKLRSANDTEEERERAQ